MKLEVWSWNLQGLWQSDSFDPSKRSQRIRGSYWSGLAVVLVTMARSSVDQKGLTPALAVSRLREGFKNISSVT